MSATTPRPNRRQRRLAVRKARGDKPMSREQLSKEEAIEKLRAQIEPEQYLESLKQMKAVYLERAAGLLGDHDMNVASPTVDPRDVEMVNKQVDDTLAELSWRVATIDQRIADFEATKKGVTRPFDRAPEVSPDGLDDTDVAVDEELTKEGLAILEAEAGANQSDESQVDMARREMATPNPEEVPTDQAEIMADPNEEA